MFDQVTGLRLDPLLRALTEGTGEINLPPLFRAFGIKAEKVAPGKPSAGAALGIKTRNEDGWVRVSRGARRRGGAGGRCLRGRPARGAGRSAAGAGPARQATGHATAPATPPQLHLFRRDELQVLPVTLAREPAMQYKVNVEPGKHAARAR